MNDEGRKKLRELAEKATPGPWSRTRDNGVYAGNPRRCIGSMYDSEFVAAANPETAIALLNEIERLRTLIARMGRGTEILAGDLDNARDLLEDVGLDLRAQLAAMTAARDEACDLFVRKNRVDPVTQLEFVNRISALRKVGSHD